MVWPVPSRGPRSSCRFALGSACINVSAAFSTSRAEKNASCSSPDSTSSTSARSSPGMSFACPFVTDRETVSVLAASSREKGCTYRHEMRLSRTHCRLPRPHFRQEAVERDIHVDNDQPSLRFEEVDVVHDLHRSVHPCRVSSCP